MRIQLVLVLIVVFALSSALRGDDPWKTKVDELVRPVMEKKVGVVVGLLLPSGERRVFGYGVTKKGGAQPDGKTLFEIGSITKTFTSLLLADEVVKGELKLEDPVRKFLPPDWTVPKRGEFEITFLELATHRSGLSRIPSNMVWGLLADDFMGGKKEKNPYADLSKKQLAEGLAKIDPGKEQKPAASYSNLGVGLIGEALEFQTKQSYGELIRTRIAGPLGLKDTVVELSEEQAGRFAKGHKTRNSPTPHWTFGSMGGCGAISSTGDDLLTYLAAESGRVKTGLSPAMELTQVRRDRFVGEIGIGLGWLISDLPDQRRYWWHNGATGGFTSYAAFSREPAVGVVVLCNSQPDIFGSKIDSLGGKLIGELMEGKK